VVIMLRVNVKNANKLTYINISVVTYMVTEALSLHLLSQVSSSFSHVTGQHKTAKISLMYRKYQLIVITFCYYTKEQ